MSNETEVYYGNHFNVAQAGGDWAIWRICDEDGNREQVRLGQGGMDELHAYFADHYTEDRSKQLAEAPE